MILAITPVCSTLADEANPLVVPYTPACFSLTSMNAMAHLYVLLSTMVPQRGFFSDSLDGILCN